MRNPYKHISDEPIIGTQRGNPNVFVSKIDTVANLDNAIHTLNAFRSSLSFDAQGTAPMKDFSHMADYSSVNLGGAGGGGGHIDTSSIKNEIEANKREIVNSMLNESGSSMKGLDTIIDDNANKPIVKGGRIMYEKKHSHK